MIWIPLIMIFLRKQLAKVSRHAQNHDLKFPDTSVCVLWLDCAILLGEESLLSGMNNKFRGDPFSQEDKIVHEYIQCASVIIFRKENKSYFAQSFS